MLSLALFVRLWGIDWQLPAALYFDELKYVAWAGNAKSDATAAVSDLRNPTFFHHLLQAEYAVAAVVRRGTTTQEIAVSELWLARLTSALLGGLACLLTAFAARRTVEAAGTTAPDAAWAGLAAGLILALAPLHVHLSHYAVNDATASLFLAATLYVGGRALAGGRWRELLLGGVLAGLAFSTKYSFAVGVLLPLAAAMLRAGWRSRLLGGTVVVAGMALGAVLGAPEILLSPTAVATGVAEQARLGAVRWNGQSDLPVWQLYAETLVQGLGWPALAVAVAGCVALGLRRPLLLAATLSVPLGCLAVMLRQELFFARFALPLLPSLAILAGIGTVGLVRFGVAHSGQRPLLVGGLALMTLAVQLGPAALTTVQHNQLAMTTDTRVLARRWLRQRLDGARVATEIYGQPLAWAGNEAPRGYRLQRVATFVDPVTVARLVCEGNRYFLVASLTSERELARRTLRAGESGYDLLARQGRTVATFDPFQAGMSAPAHPDNTGIPFWHLEAYARPGPKIVIYEVSNEGFACGPGGR
ncbi:MAG: glycosyltransferase family 39 protein [Chloroflexi bacterium]|nr:glycosyltransferase family 39 protein [Chloroflexota bacterium]